MLTQSADTAGLANIPNAHQGKFLPSVNTLSKAILNGKPHYMLRLRYEEVDDNIPAGSPLASADDAEQLSARIAVGWTTGRFHGFYLRGELELNRHLGDDNALNLDDDFRVPPLGPGPNPPAGNRIAEGHAIIPDNDFEEVNEFYLGWRNHAECPNSPDTCNGNTSIKLGRQEIIYDNHRWVGNILWRNNFQTFDALRIDNTSIKNLSLSYSYIKKVKRIFGEKSIFNEFKMHDSHLINVSYAFQDIGQLTAYGYLLDFDDNPRTPFVEGTGIAPGFVGPVIFDSDTWGARWVGQHEISDNIDLLTEFEWANQDPSNDADSFLDDNDYTNFELGVRLKTTKPDSLGLLPATLQIKVAQETLEGSGNNALQTPLSTIHLFQGWADKFAGAPGGSATPLGGVEDSSVTVEALGLFHNIIGKNKFVVAFHDYKSDKTIGGIKNYGNEWNMLWAKPDLFGKKGFLGMLKYADFEDGNDGFSFDTKKVWLMLQYKFN